MANYDRAFAYMIPHECYAEAGQPGLHAYANDKADHGSESYAGISRVHFPYIGLWKLIDAYKASGRIPHLFTQNAIDEAVKTFYRVNFWNVMQGDQWAETHQELANWCFDKAVNTGSGRLAKKLQTVLGVVADGEIGPKTVRAINAADPAKVLAQLKEAYRAFYLGLVEKDPSQRCFLKSWLSRV